MKSKGFALMAVLIIVILVPIVVFGITFFITSSITRYDAQTRNMTALYLAESGIHKAIFNIESTGTPLPVANWNANNQISVTADVKSVTKWGLTSTGTSVLGASSLQRIVYAEFDSAINRISAYREKPLVSPPVFPFTFYGYKWGLDEGAGTTTGTTPVIGSLLPSSARPIWVAGRVRNALSFNQGGTHNYVRIADNNGLDVRNAGSLMAWIYIPSATPVSNDGTGIVRKGNTATGDEAYGLIINRINASTRYIRFVLRDNTSQRRATGATNLTYNTWLHVAGTWGANGLRVYLNGIQDGVNTNVYVAQNSPGSLQIGTLRTGSSTTRFRGTIDEVYLHTRQLTAAEILAYYDATKP